MKVTQEELVQRQAVLKIEVEPQELERFLDRAYRRVVQKVSVPGFRRGKAPRPILERIVGRVGLLNEAMDFLIPEVTKQALEQEKLKASALPLVELVGLDPVALKATVPLAPVVELGDYRSLRVPWEPPVVSEEQAANSLERLRRQLATWVPVERPVKLEDLTVIDVEGKVDGQTLFQQKGWPYIATENSPIPLPGFAKALEGAVKGEKREFSLPFPQDYPDTNLAGKACQFSVMVNDCKERKLPELGDEFAKSVGDRFDNLEALKADLRQQLQAALEREARQAYEDKVIQQVVAAARVELPPLLVEQTVDNVMEDQAEALARRRIRVEDFLKSQGKSEDQWREEMRPQAQERLTRLYILAKVADAEGIQATDEEVEKQVGGLLAEAGAQAESLRRLFEDQDRREALRRALRRQRAIESLVATARAEPAARGPEAAVEPQAQEAKTAEPASAEETQSGATSKEEASGGGIRDASQS